MKEVYSISELAGMGFPKKYLVRIAHSDEFYRIGFKDGRQYYFYKSKLEKYLERRTKWQY